MAESEFTDTARAALLWVLWHHQGGSSPTGQAIRFALGMGQFDRLAPDQVAQAKAWAPGIPGLAHTDPAGGKAFHITKEPGPAGTSRCRVGPPLNAVYGDEAEARYMIDSYKAVMKTLADRQKRRAMPDGVVASADGWIEAGLVCQACAGDAPGGKCSNPKCVGGPIVRELVPGGVNAPGEGRDV